MSGFIEMLLKTPRINLLLLGLESSGKTFLLERIKSKFTSNYNGLSSEKILPTIGLNGILQLSIISVSLAWYSPIISVCKFLYSRNEVTIWDLGGKKQLRSIWKNV